MKGTLDVDPNYIGLFGTNYFDESIKKGEKVPPENENPIA